MLDLILEAKNIVDRLEKSHVDITVRKSLCGLIRSIIYDERFQKGDFHSATRYTVVGKIIRVEYSDVYLKDLLANAKKLLGE